ncbi:MAG: hypothetical protein AAGE52_06135 [Myxococcota bacterium]
MHRATALLLLGGCSIVFDPGSLGTRDAGDRPDAGARDSGTGRDFDARVDLDGQVDFDAGERELDPIRGGSSFEGEAIELPFVSDASDRAAFAKTFYSFTVSEPTQIQLSSERDGDCVDSIYDFGPRQGGMFYTIASLFARECASATINFAPGEYAVGVGTTDVAADVAFRISATPISPPETCRGNALVFNDTSARMLDACREFVGTIYLGPALDGFYAGPNVRTVEGSVVGDNGYSLDVPVMPLVEVTQDIEFNVSTRGLVDLPQLARVGGQFRVPLNAVEAIHVPNLTSLGRLTIWGIDGLSVLELPSLTTAGSLDIRENPDLVEIDFPRLERVDGAFGIHSNPMLPECDVEALQRRVAIGGEVQVLLNAPCE